MGTAIREIVTSSSVTANEMRQVKDGSSKRYGAR